MSEELLLFEEVTKVYPSGSTHLTILEDLTFSISGESSVAIVGKSGSGKSTLLNLAGGLDKPTQGRVLFKGDDLGKMRDRVLSLYRNRHVGFVFQPISLEDFSALENIAIPALIMGRATVRLKRGLCS